MLDLVKVSVIVPVYNVEKYLRECLDNILNQSLEDIEIICVNDGSTDNSLDILDEYSKKDSRVKVISQENKGLSGARNTGMKHVTGQYVTFMDSDDYFSEGSLEKLYGICEEKNLDVAIAKLINFDDETNEKAKSDYYEIKFLKKIVGDNVFDFSDVGDKMYNIPVTAPGKFYRYDLISDMEFPEGIIFEDNVFFTEVLFRAERIYFHDDYIYNRRIRFDSITNSNFENFTDSIVMFNKVIDVTKRYNHYDEFKYKLFRHKVLNIFTRFSQVTEEYKQNFFEMIIDEFKVYSKEIKSYSDVSKFDKKAMFIMDSALDSDTWLEFELKVNNYKLESNMKKLKKENKKLKKELKELKEFKKSVSDSKLFKFSRKLR